MDKNLYQQVINCIVQLNDFIANMDEKISKTQHDYENKQKQMTTEHQKSITKFDNDCNTQISQLEKNKDSMIKEAEEIKSKIQKIKNFTLNYTNDIIKYRKKENHGKEIFRKKCTRCNF